MQIYQNKCFNKEIKKIVAFNNQEFINALEEISKLKEEGYYLLGYIRYFAKDIFLNKEITSKYPILYFEAFQEYKSFENNIEENINLYSEELISKEDYKETIDKIKNEISLGNTYEVNYTYPYKVYSNNSTINIYKGILKQQTTPYNAFITNDWEELLSFSPELFFKIENNIITTKPMKGTIERGCTEKEDRTKYNFLKNDIKNRAENVMIVDLLRNDLSKISKTGTVKVNKLFEIEKHKTLYQMTSEISSELKENITLYEILKALFPCGSITGAPKIATMEIIDKMEKYNRDIYCGAIGFISKEETTFSVPIRILQRKKEESFYKYFVGGAIVWDSTAEEEWKETLTKKKIIDTDLEYNLIETMFCKNNNIELFDYHKNRLKNSAIELGFKFNEEDFNFELKNNRIIRCELQKDGTIIKEYKERKDINSNKICLSKESISSKNIFLKHKTTFRPWYNIDFKDNFDIIFYNERNELTEGARTNILLKLNGELYTPAISSGLLNGTLRQYLIDNHKIKEKILYTDDLNKAEKIYCINSVRGIVEVHYDTNR